MKVLQRQRLGWDIFQFSSEILLTNGVLYFLPWLTNLGVSDSWFNVALFGTSVLLVVTGLPLARLNDQRQRGYIFLILAAIFVFAFTVGIHFANTRINNPIQKGFLGLLCFSAIMYFFQLGLIFYNGMLRYLGPSSEHIRISGRAVAAGWIGAVIGILAVWPFVEGQVPFFGNLGRGGAFLPSALFYGIGTTISLVLMRGITSTASEKSSQNQIDRVQNTNTDLEAIQVTSFLIALFLFADAILTIEANASHYVSEVMHFSENGTNGLFLLLVITAAIGALIPAQIRGRVHPKRMLIGILISWVLLLFIITLTTSQYVFIFLFAMVGIVYGALFALMRAFFLSLLPIGSTSKYFTFYVAVQRFALLVGPLLWAGVAHFSQGLGSDRYRISMLAMAGLICLSFLFLRRVSNETSRELMTVTGGSSHVND